MTPEHTLPIQLSAIGCALGEPASLDTLDELAQAESTRDLLAVGGLARYLRCELGAVALAERAIADTLGQSRVDPASIGVLIYATESAQDTSATSAEVVAMCRRLGMRNATPVGLWGAACSNFVQAVATGARALRSGRADRIVVAMSDVVYPGESRVIPPALSVFSDGATACLLSHGEHGAAVRSSAFFADHDLWTGQTLDLIRNLSAGIKDVTSAVLSRAGLVPAACRWLVMNNYTLSVARLFAAAAGFKKTQLYRGLVATQGHVGTSDALLNLRQLIADGELGPGDRACVLSTGPSMCGALALEIR